MISRGKTMSFAKQKSVLGILMVGITLMIYFSGGVSLSFKSYSQVSSFEEPSSPMPQTESVTSYYDALLKAPLIVSQTTIVGIVFSHIFFRNTIRNHFQLIRDSTTNLRNVKRLLTILLSCGIALLLSATSLFLLQANSLSSELGIDLGTTFTILSATPVGPVLNLRVLTSLIIVVSSILYYVFEKKSIKKGQIGLESNELGHYSPSLKKRTGKKGGVLSNGLLYIILLAGALSIFSNSMVSHNTALSFLPSLAICLDWFHFMAVSIWLGGLFYIASILLMTIRLSIRKNSNNDGNANRSFGVAVHDTSYFLALLLPYCSLIATISLGIIGVTGLYMAWIHLHTAEAIFTSSYGNILAIKLLLILPMVILGGYHQIKLHGSMMTVANFSRGKQERHEEKRNTHSMESS